MSDQLAIQQGTLDALVLKALSWGPQHGHGVARLIRSATNGAFAVLDGSLYASLHRLEEQEFVESEWGLSDRGKQARFYRLTPRGRGQLRTESVRWSRYAAAVSMMLASTARPVEG
jgi:PadR family transcriptional regulator, regulatory protein PadR